MFWRRFPFQEKCPDLVYNIDLPVCQWMLDTFLTDNHSTKKHRTFSMINGHSLVIAASSVDFMLRNLGERADMQLIVLSSYLNLFPYVDVWKVLQETYKFYWILLFVLSNQMGPVKRETHFALTWPRLQIVYSARKKQTMSVIITLVIKVYGASGITLLG